MTCDQMSQLFEQRLRQASSLLSCGGDGGEAQDGCDQDSVAEAWPVADIAPDFDKPRWMVVPERGSSRRVSRELACSGALICRDAQGWGTQLLDRWVSTGRSQTRLLLEDIVSDFEVGVVGRNFLPSAMAWSSPLSATNHAFVVHAGSGAVTAKGVTTSLVLPLLRAAVEELGAGQGRPCALRSGTVVNVIIDQERHEFALEVLGEDNAVEATVALDDGLPAELAVAVSMGPGRQRVRVLGVSETQPTSSQPILRKMMADMWDVDNPVVPQKPRGPGLRKSRASREMQAHRGEASVAQLCD